MKRVAIVFSSLILFFSVGNLAIGQSLNVSTSHPFLHPKQVGQVTGPLKLKHPGTPLDLVTTQLAYFDVDSSHQFGIYKLPDTITLNVAGKDPFRITAFSERFTPTVKGVWYLDSAVVAFRADQVTAPIAVYAIRASRGGTFNYLYPFGVVFDSAFINPEDITDNSTVYTYTVKFHHDKIVSSQGSFFISLTINDSNSLAVYGDQIADADPSGKTIDTNVDRANWTATSVADGTTSYSGFMAGGYQDQNGNILSPNLYMIANISTAAGVTETLTSDHFGLEQNYPNAASERTTIDYSLNSTSPVSLKVYNSIGQEVANLVDGNQSEGIHSAVFDASNMPAGTYFYTLRAADRSETRSMTVTH